MKQLKVSNNVIRRLPRYLRKLDELKTAGVDRISSGELGRQMSLTSSQIRQDFSCFGEFGQQGYGYNVTGLRGEIASILGMNRDFSVILVGVGNIGRALIENFCFEQYGFHMVAAYDVRPELIGTDISGIRVHDISELPQIFENNRVDMAVLSVPKIMANRAAHELVSHGVKAIWNFTNVELDVAESDVIVENIHFSDSLLALGYYMSERMDAEKPSRKIFDAALRTLGVENKEHVLMVGDSLSSDIQGGENAGLDTCWFNPSRAENPGRVNPTYEITRLEELYEMWEMLAE